MTACFLLGDAALPMPQLAPHLRKQVSDLPGLKQRLAELEQEAAAEDLWEQRGKAAAVLQVMLPTGRPAGRCTLPPCLAIQLPDSGHHASLHPQGGPSRLPSAAPAGSLSATCRCSARRCCRR